VRHHSLSAVNMSAILFAIGDITSDVGRLTMKPRTKARGHLIQKSVKPAFIRVNANDMEKVMPADISMLKMRMEDLLFMETIVRATPRTMILPSSLNSVSGFSFSQVSAFVENYY